MDAIEEIKKLKALLDNGAITTEEFNELKKKVLSEETHSKEPQKPVTPSSIHKEMLSGAINEPKKVSKETKKKSSTVKKPLKKGNPKEDFQEPNEATTKMFKACLVLDLLLGIIFWYRYDSIIAFLICLIISIPLTLITVRIIPKLSLRNLSLIAQIIILLLLIIIPIGNVNNTSSADSSSTSSTESSTDEGKDIRDFLISHTFEDNENGVYFSMKFSSDRGGWFGVMTLTMGSCDFIYSYNLEGRSIELTYTGSTCSAQGGSATMNYNRNNTITLIYRGQEFVFKPI
jgi:hypothetical protein